MGRKKEEEVVATPEVKEEEKLTPSQYFDIIKGMKQEATEESLISVLELCEKEFKRFQILKQVEAARITSNYVQMLKKEIALLKAGFTTYVLKTDVEKYITKLSDKCVFCCEIADYPRPIDEKVFDRIANNMELFDHIYILFTDYTQKVSKKIDKKTREKDPIMFGAINLDGRSSSYPVVGPRFYYIGDWVDDFCDLTLDKLIQTFHDKEKRDDVKKEIKIPKNSMELNVEARKLQKEEKAAEGIEILSTADQIASIGGDN